MEITQRQSEDGAFDIELLGTFGLVHRYFTFGRTEVRFSAVVHDPLDKPVSQLHRESVSAVIAHLQSLLDEE